MLWLDCSVVGLGRCWACCCGLVVLWLFQWFVHHSCAHLAAMWHAYLCVRGCYVVPGNLAHVPVHEPQRPHLPTAMGLCRVRQNRIYTPSVTIYMVIPLPKMPYIHHTVGLLKYCDSYLLRGAQIISIIHLQIFGHCPQFSNLFCVLNIARYPNN
jgi:hypothetical protein